MKYIKKFESVNSMIQIDRKSRNNEILKLCGEYLIYLKDFGFRYKISFPNISKSVPNRDNDEITQALCLYMNKFNVFKWVDVKYDLIPLVELLIKNYHINDKFRIYRDITGEKNWTYMFDISEILDDDIPDDFEMTYISLYIDDKEYIEVKKRKPWYKKIFK
jgi:hypothetical protein